MIIFDWQNLQLEDGVSQVLCQFIKLFKYLVCLTLAQVGKDEICQSSEDEQNKINYALSCLIDLSSRLKSAKQSNI